jgi:hypothetical protein
VRRELSPDLRRRFFRKMLIQEIDDITAAAADVIMQSLWMMAHF